MFDFVKGDVVRHRDTGRFGIYHGALSPNFRAVEWLGAELRLTSAVPLDELEFVQRVDSSRSCCQKPEYAESTPAMTALEVEQRRKQQKQDRALLDSLQCWIEEQEASTMHAAVEKWWQKRQHTGGC